MSITGNNHYVPQSYLKRWSTNGTYILKYRKLVPDANMPLWVRKPISGVAFEKHLYSQRTNLSLNDNFEKWIKEKIEDPADLSIRKLLRGTKPSYKENLTITAYIFVQHMRTPAFFLNNEETWRVYATDIINEILNKVRNHIPSEELILNGFSESVQPDTIYPPQTKISTITDGNDISITTLVNTGRATWLTTIRLTIEKFIDTLPAHYWRILISPDDFEFPTSDNPVFCADFRTSTDFTPITDICINPMCMFLPISPKQLLVCTSDRDSPVCLGIMSPNMAENTEKMILSNSLFEVYAKNQLTSAVEQCPRIVNKDTYLLYRKFMNDWNRIQSEMELEFLS